MKTVFKNSINSGMSNSSAFILLQLPNVTQFWLWLFLSQSLISYHKNMSSVSTTNMGPHGKLSHGYLKNNIIEEYVFQTLSDS